MVKRPVEVGETGDFDFVFDRNEPGKNFSGVRLFLRKLKSERRAGWVLFNQDEVAPVVGEP